MAEKNEKCRKKGSSEAAIIHSAGEWARLGKALEFFGFFRFFRLNCCFWGEKFQMVNPIYKLARYEQIVRLKRSHEPPPEKRRLKPETTDNPSTTKDWLSGKHPLKEPP